MSHIQKKPPYICCSSGPAVHLHLIVSGGYLKQTTLNFNNQNQLTYQISSDTKDLQIEGLIDSWMQGYVSGNPFEFPLPLQWDVMPMYTKKVLEHLRALAFGVTLSYQELACLTGSPRSARAVGNACGRNPFLLIVPCHRVITSGGSLGGFSAGLEFKKILLKFEESLPRR